MVTDPVADLLTRIRNAQLRVDRCGWKISGVEDPAEVLQ